MIPQDVPMIGKLSENLMLSGGAAGADTYFGKMASAAGHQVIHWSFEGHKSYDPDNTVKLDDETLRTADIHLEEARLSMKRRIPYGKPHIANLLRRNWFQVEHAESVYAVGTLDHDKAAFSYQDPQKLITKKRTNRLAVNGGTGWACQIYFDRWLQNSAELQKNVLLGLPFDENLVTSFNLFFYDQNTRDLFYFDPVKQWWAHLLTPLLKPFGIYAAIGTRDLNDYGKTFIEELYNR